MIPTPPSHSPSAGRVRLIEGELAELWLARPRQANALDFPMGEAVDRAVTTLNADSRVRVVLLRGEGGHFCAGGDFAMLEHNTQLPREDVRRSMLHFYNLYLSLLRLKVPTIALVHGSAVGAGLCLALACDLRIGSVEARLGMNFVRLGLHPGMGATHLVPLAVGETQATALLLGGQVVGGERAAALGLLTEVAPTAELESIARRRAGVLAGGAPQAICDTLQTLRRRKQHSLPAALEREAECQATNFGSRDVRRAIQAFRNKSQLIFRGD